MSYVKVTGLRKDSRLVFFIQQGSCIQKSFENEVVMLGITTV